MVIPAYNEETRLGTVLPRLYRYLQEHFTRFEIIIVDDGSRDRTVQIAEELVSSASELRVLRLDRNYGKGRAVRRGMLAAEGDCILLSDADLSTPIEEVEKALALMAQGFDIVIGSRALPDSDVQVHQNIIRETMGKTFNLLVRAVSRLPFRDTQCGFKCFTRNTAHEIFARAVVDGFAFDVEALVLARRLGYSATDMPIRWVNSQPSKVGIIYHPAQMLWELIRIRINECRGRYDRSDGLDKKTPGRLPGRL